MTARITHSNDITGHAVQPDQVRGEKLLEDAQYMSPANQAFVSQAVEAWRSMAQHEIDALNELI